jgi:hypothetical protein
MRRSPSSDPEVQKERQRENRDAWRKRNAGKVRAQERASWERNKEKRKASGRKYRQANREYYAQKQREWVAKNPEKAATQKRTTHLKRKYGISIADYDAMFDSQGGRCAVCSASGERYAMCVDHDHASGVVRSLLCDGCNKGIGMFAESPERMRWAADYIERFTRARTQ